MIIEVKLNSGDAIQIGREEYIFFDKEEEAKKTQPKDFTDLRTFSPIMLLLMLSGDFTFL